MRTVRTPEECGAASVELRDRGRTDAFFADGEHFDCDGTGVRGDGSGCVACAGTGTREGAVRRFEATAAHHERLAAAFRKHGQVANAEAAERAAATCRSALRSVR